MYGSVRITAFVLAFVLVLGVTGCDCGGTIGRPCDNSDDCDPGEFCDPATLECNTLGSDAATGDSGSDAGMACVDADDDGVTDCAGDCDDGDPLTYPGAPEVCGDGVTNDCDSMDPPDTGCMGLGTYVAPPPLGNDANPGTMTMPVATINEGIVHAMMIGGGVDVYVAADVGGPGVFAEDIVMVEGISLLGGYESAGWTRDPAANDTVIASTNTVGVLFESGISRATAIDGFTVEGQTGPATASAITIEAGAEPEVTGNVIAGPNSGGASIGIVVNPGSAPNAAAPLIAFNIILLGSSASGWGPNTGASGLLVHATDIEVLANVFFISDNPTIQTAINVMSPPTGAIIGFNLVRGIGTAEAAFGMRVTNGFSTVDSNDVDPGDCFNFCVGIAVAGGWGPTVIAVTNNVSFGGTGPSTIGFDISFEAAPPMNPDILVHSNYFNGGGTPPPVGPMGTTVGVNLGELLATPVIAGRFYNNIINSGIGEMRYAMREQDPEIDPELLENNALFVDPTMPVFTSALYVNEGNTNLTDAMMVNAVPTHAGNLEDGCMVTNPTVDGDFHLLTGSNCIDAGSLAELPAVDFEGDVRPMGAGPDIGVDETP